ARRPGRQRQRQEVADRGAVIAERADERVGERQPVGAGRDRGIAASAGERGLAELRRPGVAAQVAPRADPAGGSARRVVGRAVDAAQETHPPESRRPGPPRRRSHLPAWHPKASRWATTVWRAAGGGTPPPSTAPTTTPSGASPSPTTCGCSRSSA